MPWTSASEQARLVRDGERSSRELVEESLAAIERLDGELNAFIHVDAERALSEADAVAAGDHRPLAGVPIAMKDLLAPVAGMPMRWGSAAMEGHVSKEDGNVARRLRRAGAIVLGKTATPELGILPVTEPDAFGDTRNPWDTGRTPGGSSGGSGAAVAAGMVSLAHGNDGGGSIRIPASSCGLVGLKPSRGRISLQPDWSEGGVGLATDGVLTRTVHDTAMALDLLAGYEPGDAYTLPPPPVSFAEAARREPGRLRIAFETASPNGCDVHPDCVRAVQETAALLESLGHSVEQAAPTVDPESYVENFIKVWIGETGEELHTLELIKGEPLDRDRIEPLTRQMAEIADSMSATDFLVALDFLRRISREIMRFWGDYDVVLTPTLAQPAIEIGSLRPKEGAEPVSMLLNSSDWVPFTPVWNVTGQPAISLPLHQSADGLPVGVQFIAALGGEDLLLSLAGQLEQALPWADRRPPLAVPA